MACVYAWLGKLSGFCCSFLSLGNSVFFIIICVHGRVCLITRFVVEYFRRFNVHVSLSSTSEIKLFIKSVPVSFLKC